MKNKISLAGDLGSGKSTVSALLVEALSLRYYSTGAIVRSLAQKHGMSVADFNIYMETHPEIDREIDDGLVALGREDKPMIIDSRMAWHFAGDTYRVYLSADAETSAARIMSANRTGEHAATLEETVAETKKRRQSEKKRYLSQYGVDIKDMNNYDLVVDTTSITPVRAAEVIREGFARWQDGDVSKKLFLSPERLWFPDESPDAQTVAALSSALERGEPVPPVEVTEEDGEFYIVVGAASALAQALLMTDLIPATLTSGQRTGAYVRMKNSL